MAVWSNCACPGSARSRAGSRTCGRGWAPTCSRRSRATRARTGGSGSTARPGRAGSPRTVRSGGCTATRRCSSAACARCSCSRCTRWRWPGVAGHSGYRGDPWGRLARTSYFLAATTFGPDDEARETIERIKAVHARVRGRAPDGRAYSAGDPHLLEWVHIAEIDSFLRAHQRYGSRPLDQAGRDGYVADTARIARELGVARPAGDRGGARGAGSRPSGRSSRAPPRPARRPGSCCSTRPSRSPPGRRTRCWPRRRWSCCRRGPARRCGCPTSRSIGADPGPRRRPGRHDGASDG